jgi:hypothetical protein
VARRKRDRVTYKYDCNITGDTYVLTQKSENPEELMSVNAWYDLNPEKDDRPEGVKKKLGLQSEAEAEAKE